MSRSAPRWLIALSVATVAVVVTPIAYLLIRALENGWAPYWEAIASSRVALLTWRSSALTSRAKT